MKRLFFTLLCMVTTVACIAQLSFSCEQIAKDAEKWNANVNKSDNDAWANAIKDNHLYKMNNDGSIEYVYIIQATDSFDIQKVRNVTFDYICRYFNMNNESRANMVANSEGNSVYFQGMFSNMGQHDNMNSLNRIHANMIITAKFKANRIRLSLKFVDYDVVKVWTYGGRREEKHVYVNTVYPFVEKCDHKKSYAMAFINANSNCINYANKYLDYLNKNVSQATKSSSEEDW